MAGHSHSANVRFRKDRVDAAKAKVFSKLARMITVAAKLGGGDASSNPRLRLAIDKARVENMPKDNIERAIKKGTGEGASDTFEEIVYEGYAAGGVAVILDALTDNRNRTSPEIRKLFEKAGGNLGASGAVAYMFERRSVFVVEPDSGLDEDRLLEITLEAGAEDLVRSGDTYEIHGAPGDFDAIRQKLEAAEVPLAAAEVTRVAQNSVRLESVEDARKVLGLLEALEDHDDVQGVSANYDLSEEVAAALDEAS